MSTSSQSTRSDEEPDLRSHYIDMERSKLRVEQIFDQLAQDHKYEGVVMSEDEHSESISQLSYSDQSFLVQEEEIQQGHSNLKSEIEQLAQEQEHFLENIKANQQADQLKGQHVRNQLQFNDALMDLRIRSQALFQKVNTLPPVECLQLYPVNTDTARTKLKALIGTLLAVQQQQVESNEGLFKVNKRQYEDNSDIKQMYKRFKAFEQVQVIGSTVDKWQSKLNVTSKKGLKVLDQPISVQVRNIIQNDSVRVLGRTRQARLIENRLGQQLMKLSESQVFIDDYDFYQMQLKELIQTKSMDIMVPQKKLSKQKKAGMNKMLNKDRTVKYALMDKLVNFMTCRSDPFQSGHVWHEEMVDELTEQLKAQ